MPPLEERTEYPYQNIRTKNFQWGDGDKVSSKYIRARRRTLLTCSSDSVVSLTATLFLSKTPVVFFRRGLVASYGTNRITAGTSPSTTTTRTRLRKWSQGHLRVLTRRNCRRTIPGLCTTS
jgi:hypothetical protein